MTTKLLIYTILSFSIVGLTLPADVSVAYRNDSPQLDFAVGKLRAALSSIGLQTVQFDLATLTEEIDIFILSSPADQVFLPNGAGSSSIRPEGYEIRRSQIDGREAVFIVALDESGAMYGTLHIAEQIRMAMAFEGIEEGISNPNFPFRAIKFNLPWSSYRPEENPAMYLHLETTRTLEFWQQFLDMMAENRFNVLTLWNLHPWSFMIRAKNFPEACPFSEKELTQWQRFWQQLFLRAKERGIETYIVNWNVFVSPEFQKAHQTRDPSQDYRYHFGDADTSELVRRYNRESVEQVIAEYPNLTGIGISLGERMDQMTPQERQDWIVDVYFRPISEAGRTVKFIHRAPFSIDPAITRQAIENLGPDVPIWVPVKFNWSHGHSTPRLRIIHGGEIDDSYWTPPPQNYRLIWTVRNEDFFVLRWGDPTFIREHILENKEEYVGGYIIGSEGYIPAKDYFHKQDSHVNWSYAFERQWLFYKLWGRLLFDPETEDKIFAAEFRSRYGEGVGQTMLEAFSRASRMPLELASFHASTWDFALYSEGFLAPAQTQFNDEVSAFISVDELIRHTTLDPTYLSIPEYVEITQAGESPEVSRVTPLALADILERDGRQAIATVDSLRRIPRKNSSTLDCEISDIQTWAYLSLYFAEKLRGAVSLETFRRTGQADLKQRAVSFLENAVEHWKSIIQQTDPHYRAVPAVQLSRLEKGHEATFAWSDYLDQVQRDVTIAREAASE